MGHTIPRQHPAVVLRSHYLQLRALLAVALVAVLALAGTVVILAVDDGPPVTTGKTPGAQISKVGIPTAFGGPTMAQEIQTRRAAVHGKATPVHQDTRPDGGPDEGTRGIIGR